MIPTRPPSNALFSLLGLAGPFAAALLSASVAQAQSDYATPYAFTTLAGSPNLPGGNNGTGAAAQFDSPSGLATDSSGNVYVADQVNETIRMITPGGVVTTVAGSLLVSGSANGTGTAATFNGPIAVAVDSAGNIYVCDQGNSLIRKIAPGGVVTTLAGSVGVSGSNDGTGTSAQFNLPSGIAVDSSGNVYVSDSDNDTIRKITSAGVVTTIAGSAGVSGSINGTGTGARFNAPVGITVDGSGNLFVADTANDLIREITPAGVVTTLAGRAKVKGSTDGTGSTARFFNPTGVAVDGSDNVYVADEGNSTVRKVTSGGVVTTIAGVASAGGFADGPGASARFDAPYGAAIDGSGNVYISDVGFNTIRKITPGDVVSTLAGTPGSGFADGTGAAAQFDLPTDLVLDPSGNLYVVDNTNNVIRKVTPAGVVTTFVGTPGEVGSADGTGPAVQFNYPYGIAMDGSGNLYVTDQGNQTIRKITPGGTSSTIAGTALDPGSANGTGSAALFYYPAGIAVDASGNLYVTEERNFDIRMITPAGVVTTLAGTAGTVGNNDGTGPAAQFRVPAGVTLDPTGKILYVVDFGNSTIRKVTIPGGVVTTIAGTAEDQGFNDGTGAAAQFNNPSGVAIDASGNLYVADEGNNEIREISPAGAVTTLAGTPPPFPVVGVRPPRPGFADGTGAAALFYAPFDVVVDSSGTLYVTDAGNNAIRAGAFAGAPQIQTQPSGAFVVVGGSATFTVAASGASPLSYQWNFNGAAIAGATGSSYNIPSVQASDAGTYTVTITNGDGSATSAGASLTINSGTLTTRLINISTRAQVGTGANILIPGFAITGSGTETLLIRADGPSLTQYGVAGVLAQPSLTVYDSNKNVVATNTGWGTNSNPALIASTSASVGAFAFASGSADCALIVSLAPGSYTAQVSGVGSTTGVALAEVYEVSSTGTRLVNISTRAMVGTGANILIPGFAISGPGTEPLLIRADGPSLTQYGVTGVLSQPALGIYSGQTVVASNTGWGTAANPSEIASDAASVGAFAFATGSADSAQIVNLTAGSYTIQISGVGSTTGVALAEVYELP
jgi:sugar lactone lactonase YvrE